MMLSRVFLKEMNSESLMPNSNLNSFGMSMHLISLFSLRAFIFWKYLVPRKIAKAIREPIWKLLIEKKGDKTTREILYTFAFEFQISAITNCSNFRLEKMEISFKFDVKHPIFKSILTHVRSIQRNSFVE